jgi:hypothetical protein
MTHASRDDAHRLLYLDGVHVGQRFTTGEPSRSRPERGMVKVRSETRNQRGEVGRDCVSRWSVPGPNRHAWQSFPVIRRRRARKFW